MNPSEYILTKQTKWAEGRGIKLIGSKGSKGRRAYTTDLDTNLFEPISPEASKCFLEGDGGEIMGTATNPAKMQAVHSSSALGVNIFHYWQGIGQASSIAAACGLCAKGSKVSKRIVFEEKFPIDEKKFRFSPNIDAVIYNADSAKIKCFAIECKFSEAYGAYGHNGLKQKYLKLKYIWADVPNLHKLAKTICPDDTKYKYIHPAQLIKHILGLKNKFNKEQFMLLYLWYDIPGEEGYEHRKEVEVFSKIAKKDKIKFHTMTYQELIVRLASNCDSAHKEYITYIANRYL